MVLEHCNLHIDDGEKIGLVGCSGAGKSTIIELVSGSMMYSLAVVSIGGQNVKILIMKLCCKMWRLCFKKHF